MLENDGFPTRCPMSGAEQRKKTSSAILRVCVCGLSLYHLPLAVRAVTEICPELTPCAPGESSCPEGPAAVYPEISALRILATNHYGCHLVTPFGGQGQPVEDLDQVLAEHPLLLFYDAVFPFTSTVLGGFDRVIFLNRDLADMFAANALAHFHLRDKAAGQAQLDDYFRANVDKASNFWSFQTQGFITLKQRLPVYFLDFDLLVSDRDREFHRLAAFLGHPAPAAPSRASLLDNTRLPLNFTEPGLGERILPADVLTTLKRACPGPTKTPASDFPLPWEFRNTLHVVGGRSHPDHVVVHIPARSGSTRLIDKNIVDLCGKPLMAWTILMARRIPGVDRVIVNTDDAHYAALAREYGAETPFLRPKQISGTEASLGDATDFLANYLVNVEGYDIAKLVTLSPASPFRTLAEMTRLLGILDCYPLVQTCLPASPDWSALYIEGLGHPLSEALHAPLTGRYPFKSTGAFTGRSFVASGQGLFLAPHRSPVELVDIDVQEDLDLACLILSAGLHDFGVDLC